MLLHTCIVLFWVLSSHSHVVKASIFNLALPHQHPFPDSVAEEVQRRVNESTTRRKMLALDREAPAPPCLTGNPIDDCWRCDEDWQSNRQRLADCGIGFGHDAVGGKGGRIYLVTDSSDDNPADPTPGTLRHAVIQDEPLWITFSADMVIKLSHALIVNSFKTIDGRGAAVHIVGNGCVTVQSVSNVIIHNVHIHNCKPSGSTRIRSSPTRIGSGGKSDGDGISITSSSKIWVDHCSLSYCTDGLIDVIRGSSGITISNNYFSHHDKVMLLGHDDRFLPDTGMQVTVAFNHFGEKLVERMPRCRHGYVHVVNNDYTQWGMYAIGGSASPTINSQGNRYIAPADHDSKEVTKRMDTDEDEWAGWNWRSEGDIMVNGAFFVPSGAGASAEYSKASSLAAKSAVVIDQLTGNAGVFGDPRDGGRMVTNKSSDDGDDYFGLIIRSDSAPPPSAAKAVVLSLLTILILGAITCDAMFSLQLL